MLEFAKKMAREAGSLALGYYKEGMKYSVKTKPDDLVTEADLAVSNFIINQIKNNYPDHGILSEEEEEIINDSAQYVWVIDPIDGTRNFAKHIAVWCIMIGLEKDGKPYIGVIYDAVNDELFYAEIGKGAFLNDHKIEVNRQSDLDYCFLSYSGGENRLNSPYNIPNDIFDKYKRFYVNLIGDNGHWVSNYGTLLSISHLATGRIDAVVNDAGLYHDYLASVVIAREAGALVTDSDGNPWKKGRRDIVIANPLLHKKLLELF